MKKLSIAIAFAMALNQVAMAVLLIYMPDIVPAHYNFAGEVDRFGSKYELLFFPAFAILMTGSFLLLARYQRRKAELINEKILLYSAVLTLILFAVLGFYFGFKALRYDPAANAPIKIDVMKFTGIAIGLLLLGFGCAMPKLPRNSIFGLRTKWSMANDALWQKSQGFGGIASAICGLIMILLATLLSGLLILIVNTIVFILWLVLCILASYWIYMRE